MNPSRDFIGTEFRLTHGEATTLQFPLVVPSSLVLLTLAGEQVTEHLPQVGEVGLVVKAQRAAVLEVRHKLHWVALAQHLGGGGKGGNGR